jgi:hypothetical protein
MINYLLVVLIGVTNLSHTHPFHVTVCDVTYKSHDKHLKISVRIFLDDLELALRKHTGNEKLDIVDEKIWEWVEQKSGEYLLSKLNIKDKTGDLQLVYLGSEIEVDVLWAYLEVRELSPFDQLSISFTSLLETYDDQENLVHVRKDDVVRSLRLNNKTNEGILKWK